MRIRVFTKRGSFIIDEIKESLEKRMGKNIFYPWHMFEELTAWVEGETISKIWSDKDERYYYIVDWEFYEATEEEKEVFIRFLNGGILPKRKRRKRTSW